MHFGSLVAALASYCDARHHDGHWQLRIDDIDTQRVVKGSIDAITHSLEAYGFAWDGDIVLQSTRQALYQKSLEQLMQDGLLYHCSCTRKQLQGKIIYPGFCRPDKPTSTAIENGHALRIRLEGNRQYNDKIQGLQTARLPDDVGDVIAWRRDAVFSYSLVAAVDDSDGISHVIRGADLLPATNAQRYLMECLGRPQPEYAHVPVALDADHKKLGKQTNAPALDLEKPLVLLHEAWRFLGQETMHAQSVAEFWQYAIQRWDISKIPAMPASVHA